MYYSSSINSAFYELPERSSLYLCRSSNRAIINTELTSFMLWEHSKFFLFLFRCFLFLNYTLHYKCYSIATQLFTTGKKKKELVHKSHTKISLSNLNMVYNGSLKYIQLMSLLGLSQYFSFIRLGLKEVVRLYSPTVTTVISSKIRNTRVTSLDVLCTTVFVASFLRLSRDNKFLIA